MEERARRALGATAAIIAVAGTLTLASPAPASAETTTHCTSAIGFRDTLTHRGTLHAKFASCPGFTDSGAPYIFTVDAYYSTEVYGLPPVVGLVRRDNQLADCTAVTVDETHLKATGCHIVNQPRPEADRSSR
ncbi:hypothetical protein [Streptomyces silvensis]|uniref:Uncharacterized protein n=1 Tax=Streptomyces silvensis TaxID=1765722 RepID=A0A0W7X204_9ACTN|nr:hypothetical protein [Streptomyces silvensis]KUF16811.1 hypothetical protein AT728_23145 [Streptomyces silvensis]